VFEIRIFFRELCEGFVRFDVTALYLVISSRLALISRHSASSNSVLVLPICLEITNSDRYGHFAIRCRIVEMSVVLGEILFVSEHSSSVTKVKSVKREMRINSEEHKALIQELSYRGRPNSDISVLDPIRSIVGFGSELLITWCSVKVHQ
jgi:hypothetical protein